MARRSDERVSDGTAPQVPAASSALDGFIAGYLPYLLAHASHLISGQFHEHLAARKVPVMQWRVMAALWDAPKSASEVAAVILQKQPTVSKLLERMRLQGLVDRSPDETDRHRVVISLTRRSGAAPRTTHPRVDVPDARPSAAPDSMCAIVAKFSSIRSRGRSATPRSTLIREIACIANNECPPASKKFTVRDKTGAPMSADHSAATYLSESSRSALSGAGVPTP